MGSVCTGQEHMAALCVQENDSLKISVAWDHYISENMESSSWLVKPASLLLQRSRSAHFSRAVVLSPLSGREGSLSSLCGAIPAPPPTLFPFSHKGIMVF